MPAIAEIKTINASSIKIVVGSREIIGLTDPCRKLWQDHFKYAEAYAHSECANNEGF
jgi:hypothetical protein